MKTKLAILGVTFVLAAQGALASAVAEEESCLSINSAQRSLTFPWGIKEADILVGYGSPARKLLIKAKDWPKYCSSSEGSWYAILRARELLRCDPRRTLELAEQADRLVPRSPWIDTVRARLLGTVDAAERAEGHDRHHIPARLALASALLNEKKVNRAAEILRDIDSRKFPEAAELKGRLYLLKNDPKRALTEAMVGKPVAPDGDYFRVVEYGNEPTAGLDWPWIDAQVRSLAGAQLGKAREAARWLAAFPVGTLKELREALAQHTKAAEQLMSAMAMLIEDTRDKGLPRDSTAVTLARLRVLAGQTDQAVALVSSTPDRLTEFCTGLSEFLWILDLDKPQPASTHEQLRALCKGMPRTEPAECSLQ